MSCPPGITYLHGSEGGSRGEETASESRSSRAEVESSKANSKTSLSSRKENAGKSQPVDLTQVAILLCQLFTLYKGRLKGPQSPSPVVKKWFLSFHCLTMFWIWLSNIQLLLAIKLLEYTF